ncbi:MAG: DUF1343 domain-containing protein [Planctomycetota bacterium]
MKSSAVSCGIDRIRDDRFPGLRGSRIGLCCNPSAVAGDLQHLSMLLAAEGLCVARFFAPEHGLEATAQDMERVVSNRPEVVSLYGSDEASLRPDPAQLADLDLLIFDLQDIGTRYYTYAATLLYILEAAAQSGTRVMVLDRPCPIGGIAVEGGTVRPGFGSFVGALPVSIRHGMTLGELAGFLIEVVGIDVDLTVIPCRGWKREMLQPESGVPWVAPSPNMPTPETALIYPGMCLMEGTNLSEGRGTTRPFHLLGAPWLDGVALAAGARVQADKEGLEGVLFRPVHFTPVFHKYQGQLCSGVEVHVTQPQVLNSLQLGVLLLQQLQIFGGENFSWRTEPYEFVREPIAIDLLWGGSDLREGLLAGATARDIIEGRAQERDQFLALRSDFLRY